MDGIAVGSPEKAQLWFVDPTLKGMQRSVLAALGVCVCLRAADAFLVPPCMRRAAPSSVPVLHGNVARRGARNSIVMSDAKQVCGQRSPVFVRSRLRGVLM